MALWGNNDAVGSGGVVSLNYSTGVVTGSGTTFGNVGAATTGDVIRFGDRDGTYFGDAVIVGIASTTQLTIGSTAGLSGAAIASTSFNVSQLPKYTVLDSSFSAKQDSEDSLSILPFVGTATTNAGIGTNIIPVIPPSGLLVGDTILNDSNDIIIQSIGTGTISIASTISAGISTGDTLTFKRFSNGYDKYIYGVENGGIVGSGTTYALTHAGWVGVTTYMGSEGEMRVKTETLVAMSGIVTGNTPVFPPY
jgi:hypothetical protein